MLLRFSLYGFLKNQRYFEPFLILAFMEKGLSFFAIGLLIAFREVAINLFEIPSGMVADLYGRRRAMMTSFAAYLVSFVLFALASGLPLLFLAMLFFAVGDAFRTGTHKAMIFAWLRSQGREGERTRVYGYTRSWSKLGSALSVVIGAVIVLLGGSYAWVFVASIPPYLAGLVNFAGYPRDLDGRQQQRASFREVARRLWTVLRASARDADLRRLVGESMGFEGVFKAVKDYLQPLLQAAAIATLAGASVLGGLDEARQTALLVGPVFLVLYLVSAVASRKAHVLADRAGGEARAARQCWAGASALYFLLLPALFAGWYVAAVVIFVLLHVLQNLWRPVLISRFDERAPEAYGATILSIENQAKSLSTMLIAPLLGLVVDWVTAHGPGEAFWPAALVGLLVSAVFFATSRSGPSAAPPRSGDHGARA